eukprot:1134850-Alexandrium_andersonii.AAC.1
MRARTRACPRARGLECVGGVGCGAACLRAGEEAAAVLAWGRRAVAVLACVWGGAVSYTHLTLPTICSV